MRTIKALHAASLHEEARIVKKHLNTSSHHNNHLYHNPVSKLLRQYLMDCGDPRRGCHLLLKRCFPKSDNLLQFERIAQYIEKQVKGVRDVPLSFPAYVCSLQIPYMIE